jgi:hypothetical protein
MVDLETEIAALLGPDILAGKPPPPARRRAIGLEVTLPCRRKVATRQTSKVARLLGVTYATLRVRLSNGAGEYEKRFPLANGGVQVFAVRRVFAGDNVAWESHANPMPNSRKSEE